jgi:bifunctional non-homologous end joining protein LigD
MALKQYRAKRDFTQTPEPGAGKRSGTGGRAFVVQKHMSQRPHYDLRLEMDGVLKSWAVPKGPSLDPRDKRLAVQVEDHPLQYATFEGTIPEGQYGAGTVMVWDRGRWAPVGDAARDYAKGELKFRLEGERLKGKWMLVRTGHREKAKGGSGQIEWLLFKERDQDADPGASPDAVATSVATGRTMAEIASGAPAKQRTAPAAPSAANLRGARHAEMPETMRPQLAAPGDEPPAGPDWLHEVKLDGYRLLAFRRNGNVRLISRRNQDWTKQMKGLAEVIADRIPVDAIVDGEAVMLDPRGISDFQALQNAVAGPRAGAIVFFAFDLPWCDGYDLTRSPLEERRALLTSLIGTRQEGRLRLSQHIEGDGPAVFQHVAASGLEGIISKKKGSPYSQTRSSDWRKSKAFNQQEFVVGGFSAPSGSRQELGALLLGYFDGDRLVYAGRVGTGFSTETLKNLGAKLRGLIPAKRPFESVPAADAKDATWAKPELVAQVQFLGWTGDGVIRFPSFRGLREDRDPKTIVREPTTAVAAAPAADGKANAKAGKARTRKSASKAAPKASAGDGGGPLTHPNRVVFPDRGAGFSITKRQLAEYYEAVAELMLPHVADRPLSIVRCPAGQGTKAFFQKHPAPGMPDAVRGFYRRAGSEREPCLAIAGVKGLVAMAQINALEIHPWGSRLDRADRPDRLVFDLDPGPDVPWREVVEAATLLRDALKQVKLAAFVRLTGGKGLHVVVPIQRRYTWERAKTFCQAVANAFVRLSPSRFVAIAAKAHREGRIYVDYLRNTEGATAIGSYSTRDRPGAPVALPIAWDELSGGITPEAANVVSVQRRVASGSSDAWAGIDAAAAALPDV